MRYIGATVFAATALPQARLGIVTIDVIARVADFASDLEAGAGGINEDQADLQAEEVLQAPEHLTPNHIVRFE